MEEKKTQNQIKTDIPKLSTLLRTPAHLYLLSQIMRHWGGWDTKQQKTTLGSTHVNQEQESKAVLGCVLDLKLKVLKLYF